MENLPVKLLTELITYDEIIVAQNVRSTHDVKFCPIGISSFEKCGKRYFDRRNLPPEVDFAIKIWETARDNLLATPSFAGALDVEWYPVAATFRSIRYVNGSPDLFVSAMFDEMKRLADADSIQRDRKTEGRADHSRPSAKFSWQDIKDFFVVLKPIQLAFIAGDEMNNHTPLDDEFIDACGNFDLEKVKKLVETGANIHAATHYGDTAMCVMMWSYLFDENGDILPISSNKNYDKFIKIVRYLLSLGYNINISGYCDSTCLYNAPHVEDMGIIKFLLDNGADPNLGSYVGDFGRWDMGITVLDHTWEDLSIEDSPWCEKLSLLLLRRGALPIPAGERFPEKELDEWIEKRKANKEWNDSICDGLSNPDAALVYCAQHMDFYNMALIAQNGGDVSVRDMQGRNLLQIVLDSAKPTPTDRFHEQHLAEMLLMLLCGLKLKLSEAEIEQAKETCREKGYSEALDAIISVTGATGSLQF